MRYFTLAAAASLSALTGCASIVNGQNQSISVETRVDSTPLVGANCTLSNNKGTWFLTTPGSATVNRSYEDLSVKCVKDALEPGLTTVKSGTKAMAFGNILFGGVIGASVDVATGAAYDYPTLITVDMSRSALPAPAAPATTGAASPAAAAASGVPAAVAAAAASGVPAAAPATAASAPAAPAQAASAALPASQ